MVEARSVLNKSGISDYAVNCYTGCTNACRYCYARFVTKFSGRNDAWGSFVDVKLNAPEVLARQARKSLRGKTVIFSSVCDGWQKAEEEFRLTRRCLEILLGTDIEISILTKNALVERDFDLLGNAGAVKRVELGVTLTALDERVREMMEPGASPVKERLRVLRGAAARGIPVWVFLGPLLPGLTDGREHIEELMAQLEGLPLTRVYADRLNARYGVWQSLRSTLERHAPGLVALYRRLFFEAGFCDAYEAYLKDALMQAAQRHRLADRLTLYF